MTVIKYMGEWNYYHQSYKWPKLQGGDHTAVGDCQATLRVINEMAVDSSIRIEPFIPLGDSPCNRPFPLLTFGSASRS